MLSREREGVFGGRVIGPTYADEVLNPRLAAWLDTGYPPARAQLTSRDLTQWRDLGAAAFRDIVGLSDSQIGVACLGLDTPLDVRGRWVAMDEGKVRAAYRNGRRLLSALGAWPWWCFGPEGKPPRGWRTDGPDPETWAIFVSWATARFHIAATSGRIVRIGAAEPAERAA